MLAPSGRDTSMALEQSLKAQSPTEMADSGIVMAVALEQLQKA